MSQNVDWSNVRINDHLIAIPIDNLSLSPVDLQDRGNTIINIPVPYLRPGENTIIFESVARGSNFDDFIFGDVALLLTLGLKGED